MSTISLPYIPVNGDVITAANTLNDLNAIVNVVNGNLDTGNLSASAAIKGTQLAAGAAILGTQLSATANIAGTQLAAAANILGSQLSSSANISFSQLDKTTELRITGAAAAICFSTRVTADTKNRLAITTDGYLQFGTGFGTADVQLLRSGAGSVYLRDLAMADNCTFQSNTIQSNAFQGSITGTFGTFTLVTTSALTCTNPIAPAYGGTGAALNTATTGAAFYFNGTSFATVGGGAGTANKLLGWNGAGTALTALPGAVIQYALSTQAASFGTSGFSSATMFLITAASAINVTLQASPADGTVYKFCIISGTAGATLTPNGVQTILNNGQAATTLTIAGPQSGVVELTAVSGGWVVS